MSFSVSTAFEFAPQNENETAGVVLIQNNNYHFRFEKAKVKVDDSWLDGLRVIKCEDGKEIELANTLYTADRVYMRIIAREQQLTFIYGEDEACKNVLIENVDATILSTDKAGGFVGTCMGMYGSGNGTDLGSYADFDWFEYMSIE